MRVDVTIDAEVGDETNKIEKGGNRVVVCEEVEEKTVARWHHGRGCCETPIGRLQIDLRLGVSSASSGLFSPPLCYFSPPFT